MWACSKHTRHSILRLPSRLYHSTPHSHSLYTCFSNKLVTVAFINLTLVKPNEKEQIKKKHEINLLHPNDVSFGYKDHDKPICQKKTNSIHKFLHCWMIWGVKIKFGLDYT